MNSSCPPARARALACGHTGASPGAGGAVALPPSLRPHQRLVRRAEVALRVAALLLEVGSGVGTAVYTLPHA